MVSEARTSSLRCNAADRQIGEWHPWKDEAGPTSRFRLTTADTPFFTTGFFATGFGGGAGSSIVDE
jgi:hypothetical protein